MRAASKKDKPAGARESKMAAAARAGSMPSSPDTDKGETSSEDVAHEVVKLLEPKFDHVLQKLADLGETFAEITRRVDEVEHCVTALEEGELALERSSQAQKKQIETLLQKVDDLENRSRRNNLRLVGVPETWGDDKLVRLFEEWLPQELGLGDLLGQIKAERAHRLGQRMESRTRPRPVLAKLLNFQHKVALLQAYRKRRVLKLENNVVLLFQDYSAALAAQHKEFTPTCSTLVQKGVRFALVYPAILKIFHKGTTHTFAKSEDANKFVAQMSPPASPTLAS